MINLKQIDYNNISNNNPKKRKMGKEESKLINGKMGPYEIGTYNRMAKESFILSFFFFSFYI